MDWDDSTPSSSSPSSSGAGSATEAIIFLSVCVGIVLMVYVLCLRPQQRSTQQLVLSNILDSRLRDLKRRKQIEKSLELKVWDDDDDDDGSQRTTTIQDTNDVSHCTASGISTNSSQELPSNAAAATTNSIGTDTTIIEENDIEKIETGNNKNAEERNTLAGHDQQHDNSNVNEDACCSICLEPYQKGQEICKSQYVSTSSTTSSSSKFSCQHTFHANCMRKWLLNNTNCPVCRQDYVGVPIPSKPSMTNQYVIEFD